MRHPNDPHEPVYRIGVAARLCGVHPQTLRAYERQGLVSPTREGVKNRLYSESDVERVRRIQRLTRELGVNLAGVEVILRLLDQVEEMRADLESQLRDYIHEAERRITAMTHASDVPVRLDEPLLPVPRIRIRKGVDL
ncbi:MAG: MerR family transcriptional regulator [Armatimonadetes bacterium]|nr:MerR family transcriptional regulator [Armatimonadota bacterium]